MNEHGNANQLQGVPISQVPPSDNQVLTYDAGTALAQWETGGGGGGAPIDATYITQTPNVTLSNEQALSVLSTGLMKVTTGTGVISSITDSAGLAAVISDETGTGALVFGTSPTLGGTITITNAGVGADPTLSSNSANQDLTLTGNLIVSGDFTVQGTTTFIDTTTLQVEDKNIEIGKVGIPSDVTADGGGITLLGATNKTIIWDNANDNWTSNQNWNLSSGLDYKINNVSVLNATTLGSSVVNSSLTSVGTLTSLTVAGSITHDNAVASDWILRNVDQDKDIILYVNDGGVDTEMLRLDGDVSQIFIKQDVKTDRWQSSDTNTFIGVGVAGAGNLSSGVREVAFGNEALYSVTTANDSVAIGYQALYSTTEGSSNIAIGKVALYSNVTGLENVAIGNSALYACTGNYNMALGGFALDSTTGDENVAMGYSCLEAVTSGDGNIGVGAYAGDNITTGSKNIIIGYNIDADSATGSFQLNIGDLIKGDMTNGTVGLYVSSVASAVNYIKTIPSIATNPVQIASDGADANIDILFEPKGTGTINLGATLDAQENAIDNVGDITHDDATASNWTFKNEDQDKDIIFNVNDGGTPCDAVVIKGDTCALQVGVNLAAADIPLSSVNLIVSTTTSGGVMFFREDSSVLNGNTLGFNVFSSRTPDTTIVDSGFLEYQADGNWTNTSTPGRFSFLTTPTGSTTPVKRVVIKSNGNVGIGTTFPNQLLTIENSISLKEISAANADTAAYGQIWVKDDTPNLLKFTNDAGADYFVALSDGDTGGAGSAGAGNQYVELNIGGTTYKVLHDGTV